MNKSKDLQIARKAATLLQSGFVILDLETTSPADDPQVAITEVGILDHQGKVIFHTLVNPERQISEVATEISGLNNRDVAGTHTFRDIYSKLTKYLNDKLVIAYPVESEQGILSAATDRYKLPAINPKEWRDAARMYAEFCHSDRFVKLIEACEAEGIEIENAHNTLGDCRMTLALIKKLVEYSANPGD